MNKVYEEYQDLHVRKTYIYAKNADVYAYSDIATTVKIASADLEDMFRKGAIIVAAGVEYAPISMSTSLGVTDIVYVIPDETTVVELAILYSSEHTL